MISGTKSRRSIEQGGGAGASEQQKIIRAECPEEHEGRKHKRDLFREMSQIDARLLQLKKAG